MRSTYVGRETGGDWIEKRNGMGRVLFHRRDHPYSHESIYFLCKLLWIKCLLKGIYYYCKSWVNCIYCNL